MRIEIVALSSALALLGAGPAFAVDGAALFKEHCAMCHGEDGNAQTPMGKELKAHPIHAGAPTPATVVEHVRSDPRHKPISEGLTDAELEAIAHALPPATEHSAAAPSP